MRLWRWWRALWGNDREGDILAAYFAMFFLWVALAIVVWAAAGCRTPDWVERFIP